MDNYYYFTKERKRLKMVLSGEPFTYMILVLQNGFGNRNR